MTYLFLYVCISCICRTVSMKMVIVFIPQIQQEAEDCLQLLNDQNVDHFEDLFIYRTHFHTAFDQSISIE